MTTPAQNQPATSDQRPAPTDTWQLLGLLIEEAMGMTGIEAADYVRINRGADWIRAFKKAFPLQYAFIVNGLIQGTVDQAMDSLIAWQPEMANLPFARKFIEGVQQKLRGEKYG